MSMIIHNLRQGSPEWHQFRLEHFGASEAAAMLGLSKKVTRSELLRMKATGIAKEFSDWVQQNVLDHGHAVEALARPIVEELIHDDLYPVTCSEGKLSASCDGLTMAGDVAFEHKQWSMALAASVADCVLPDEYQPQAQQIMMVTGATCVIFAVSDGTRENMVHMRVLPNEKWQDKIRSGWEQFEKDLAAYQPPQGAAPTPLGRSPETLPALHIEVTGMVTASNLTAYKEHALAVLGAINRDLQTDQDFADAEKIVKWCGDVESRLEAAKEHALGQTSSIDQLFKAIDDIKAECRRTRLDLDKTVGKRKEEIRLSIVLDARRAYQDHVVNISAEINPADLTLPEPDFAGAIKGKRSLDSMRDAVDTALANGKIAADAQAKAIRANLAIYHRLADGKSAIFRDLDRLLHKAADDFELTVKTRIDAHAAEIAAQAEAAARAKIEAEEAMRRASAPPAETAPAPQLTLEAVAKVLDVAPLNALVQATTPPTLKLGTIVERLGFTLTADFLKSLGFEPAATDKNAKLYHESDFGRICNALCAHIRRTCQSNQYVVATIE